MNHYWQLRIYGEPKGQPRPRAFARRMGSKYVARVYDSDVADEWKETVDETLAKERPLILDMDRLLLPIKLELTFVLRRPTSHKGKHGNVRPAAPRAHTQKPDADNLAKLVLDRMTRNGGYWRDDSQVVELIVRKQWDDAEAPGCIIRLDWLE